MTPTTEQDAPVAQPFWLRTIALGVLLFALQTVDVVRLTVNMVSVSSLAWLFIAALITASALGWAVLNSRWHGWRLIAALFIAHYGVATLTTAVEAAYLVELRELLPVLLVNGALTAALFAPAAVAIHGRWFGAAPQPSTLPAPRQLAWRLPVLAVTWMLLFVAAGALVFLPAARLLAPELLESGYADVPAWVLPFQGARGLLWLGLSLPLLASLAGRGARRGMIMGALFAALVGGNLLLPNPLMSAALRTAHFAEVALSSFVFGWLAGVLLTPAQGGASSARVRG